MRIVLLGSAGAGKSTMARRLIGDADVPRLSLDELVRHRRIFEACHGRKREHTTVASYTE